MNVREVRVRKVLKQRMNVGAICWDEHKEGEGGILEGKEVETKSLFI